MAYLDRLFIDEQNASRLRLILSVIVFVSLLAIGYQLTRMDIEADLQRQNEQTLAHLTRMHDFAISALRSLRRDASAPPCSEDFLRQMQVIAFRPDGLNVFFYAPGGVPKCGTNQPSYRTPAALGPPDLRGENDEPDLWIGRDLQPVGMAGEHGTIAMLGALGVVIPKYSLIVGGPEATNSQVVVRGNDGRIWPLAGRPGLYQTLTSTTHGLAISPTVVETSCGPRKIYCVVSQANFASEVERRWPTLIAFVLLGTVFAWLCALAIVQRLTQYWSFEARFARNLNERSIVLVYQPIIELHTGRVSGCEVLARWRDIDGSIVSPVRFIGHVRQLGRTFEFTQIVAARAYEEVMQKVPTAALRINFNIFACDFNTSSLLSIFDKLNHSPNFQVAMELVEDEHIDYDQAKVTIRELRKRDIKTYIDDFGTGYSSIERVATLGADGVKLDRSFAMSSPDSVLGRMFEQVLHLVQASGNTVIVEGVETQSRLELLRQTGLVQYVQGYLISPPIGISEFAAFLAARGELSDGKAASDLTA
ncbi:MAG: EAL domain-containing protein [Proteobacteria bacterium]|nr:EAL domain-containing protein [Pseudomonadota bacterium]